MGRLFFVLGFVTVLLLLVDLYAYQGVRQLTQSLEPLWRKVFRFGFFLPTLTTVILFIILATGIEGFMERKTYGFFYFVFGFAILFLLPKLVFVFFHLADDLTHAARWVVSRFRPEGNTNPAEGMTRLQFFNQVGLGVSALVFGSLLYGLTRGKFAYRILREELTFPDFPHAFDGLRIVQISDAHLGSFLDNSFEEVRRGLDMINDLEPDLILFTGDLVNNFAHEAEPWVPYFSGLRARIGKFSILGNHDYGDYVFGNRPEDRRKWEDNLRRLQEIHGEMGFRLLRNEHVTIEREGEVIRLIGVENWGRGRFSKYGDLPRAMEGMGPDGFRILLSHDPTHWEDHVMGKEAIHLTLSGHTHGAQMGLEAPMLNIKVSPSPLFGYKRWAGLYREGGQCLYVNRGFGFLGFPGRVGMPPEITCFDLRRA